MPDESTPCECQNCGYVCDVADLESIQDFWSRVEPGEICPAGECPKCGALSHIQKPPPRIVVSVRGGIAEVEDSTNWPCDLEVIVVDWDVDPDDDGHHYVNDTACSVSTTDATCARSHDGAFVAAVDAAKAVYQPPSWAAC